MRTQTSTGNGGTSSSMINLSSVGNNAVANGNISSSSSSTVTAKTMRSESMAYPTSHVDTVRSKIQFYLRQNSKGVFCTVAFLLVIFIITSDTIHDMGRRAGSLRRPALRPNRRGSSARATTRQSNSNLEHVL